MAIRNKDMTINLYAMDNSTNLPASGLTDISGYIIKDGATPAFLTNSISEPSGAILPGVYQVTLTSGEMDADFVLVGGKSVGNPSTVVVYPWSTATDRGYFNNISGQVSSIVSSGNAAGWNSVSVTVTGIAPFAITQIVNSGTAAGWAADTQAGVIISGIFDEVVNGSKTFRQGFEEIWSYAIGEISASGTDPYYQTYKDMDGSGIFTLSVSGAGRTTT